MAVQVSWPGVYVDEFTPGAPIQGVGTNTPVQSGDPRSPHYRDLFEEWALNRYVPVAFSRERVEAVAESRVQLAPRPGTP